MAAGSSSYPFGACQEEPLDSHCGNLSRHPFLDSGELVDRHCDFSRPHGPKCLVFQPHLPILFDFSNCQISVHTCSGHDDRVVWVVSVTSHLRTGAVNLLFFVFLGIWISFRGGGSSRLWTCVHCACYCRPTGSLRIVACKPACSQKENRERYPKIRKGLGRRVWPVQLRNPP